MPYILTAADLLNLKRWNTPTVYNGWEQVTVHDRNEGRFNHLPTHDYMPQMGVMVGYAATVIVEPSNPRHQQSNPDAQRQYMEYLAALPSPVIIVVQDLDSPHIGSFWGEINANMHKALGCVGTITDGAIRDVDEMTNAGFKAIAKHLCVGHAYSTPVKWGVEVEVFGARIRSGDFIHADKHGFMAIDPEDTKHLMAATRFMDQNECNNLLSYSRTTSGISKEQFIVEYSALVKKFKQDTDAFIKSLGEE